MAQDTVKNIESICNEEVNCSCGEISMDSVKSESSWKTYMPLLVTVILFIGGLLFDHAIKQSFFRGYVRLLWYILAYLPVALPSIKYAVAAISQKDFFNEFTLMIVATLGAFLIGEYPEAVAVMLFYSIGEMFQNSAVLKETE